MTCEEELVLMARALAESEKRAERLASSLREAALSYHVFNGQCTTDLPHCEQALCVGFRAALLEGEPDAR